LWFQFMDSTRNIFITTAPRISTILAKEVRSLGFKNVETEPKGV